MFWLRLAIIINNMSLRASYAYQLFYKNEEELKAKLWLAEDFWFDDADTFAKNLAYGQQRRLKSLCSGNRT